MSFIIYAWLSSLTYGVGGVIGKLATTYHIKNPWTYNIVWALLTFLFIVPFALIGHVGLPADWTSMIFLGIASAISSVTFTFAFYAVDLSILSPLGNMRSPITALLGVFLFHESLSSTKWLLITLLFIAGLFIHVDENMKFKSFFSKATFIVFVWILTSVLFNTMIKYASMNNGYWEVSFWSNLLTVIFLLPTYPLFIKDLKKIPFKNYSGITVNTALWTAGLLFSIKALGENVSISTAIMSVPLSMILVMILSFVSPKLLEKHSLKVYAIRTIAAGVMFVSALGLSS
jgi:drug/metabolite transporter (DMT)-like permease